MPSSSFYPKVKSAALRSSVPGVASLFAKFLRWKDQENWPISAKTRLKPQNWRGWPEGKRFAVVLTHDVLSTHELEGLQMVAELERRAGFCSAFFIRPDQYSPTRERIHQLRQDGFEIGLYHSASADFTAQGTRTTATTAQALGASLLEWSAVGVRSKGLLKNPGALHKLGVRYLSSSHDNDLFSELPIVASSIFPFWVQDDESSEGIVELPCSLPAPRTLLTLLGEGDIAIWKQKVDWIAEQGGMVLLNAPLADLRGEVPSVDRQDSPIHRYRELLDYIASRYGGEFWNGLPRQVADFCAAVKPIRPKPRNRKVCMLAYAQSESDHRILRYANALADRGDEVDVLALGGEHPPLYRGYFGSLWMRHLQGRDYSETSKWDYLFKILSFNVRAFVTLSLGVFRRRYDLIHVHNIPDFLVFSALMPRLTGTRIILDIHDLLPEFYQCKFHAKGVMEELTMECLRFVEKSSAALSNHVIIANHLWYEKLIHRTVTPDRCTPLINYIDLSTFSPRHRQRSGGAFRIIFPGGLQWHQGLDIGIRAFKDFHTRFPNSEFHIYGQGNEKPQLIALAEELGISQVVTFFPGVNAAEIPGLIAESDLGVVPKRADSFGNEAYSTKIMEYMSQGLPVAVSRTKVDQYYFSENEVRFFPSGDSKELAEAMWELATNVAERRRLAEAGLRYVKQNNWEVKKLDYIALVDSLLHESVCSHVVPEHRDAA